MSIRVRAVSVALCVFLASGCPDKSTVKLSEGGKEASRRQERKIVLELPGDDIGGPEQQAILDSLKSALESGQGLAIVSSGFGMGTVEVVVLTADDESTRKIGKILEDVYPNAKYRIEATTQ